MNRIELGIDSPAVCFRMTMECLPSSPAFDAGDAIACHGSFGLASAMCWNRICYHVRCAGKSIIAGQRRARFHSLIKSLPSTDEFPQGGRAFKPHSCNACEIDLGSTEASWASGKP